MLGELRFPQKKKPMGSTRPQCHLPVAATVRDREIAGDGEGGGCEGDESTQRHELDTQVTIGPPAGQTKITET